MELIEMIKQPAFCVQDNKIVACNHSAQARQITTESNLDDLLGEHADAYKAFVDGVLYLQITADGENFNATITRTTNGDVFLLDTIFTDSALQAMALSSQHLRNQLSSVMVQAVERLDQEEDGSIIRGLYRLQRMLCNMSDLPLYRSKPAPTEMLELGAAVQEIMEKANTLLSEADYHIDYVAPKDMLFACGDYEMLERAIFNLLSNAAKHSPKGSTFKTSLTGNGKVASISIEDSGSGISSELYGNLFTRYQREPSIEDGLCGIGLGMSLVQSVAAFHGGTVLITRTANGGTRVVLSISMRTPKEPQLRSPTFRFSDYAGGNDHGLLEFSDILPPKMYSK